MFYTAYAFFCSSPCLVLPPSPTCWMRPSPKTRAPPSSLQKTSILSPTSPSTRNPPPPCPYPASRKPTLSATKRPSRRWTKSASTSPRITNHRTRRTTTSTSRSPTPLQWAPTTILLRLSIQSSPRIRTPCQPINPLLRSFTSTPHWVRNRGELRYHYRDQKAPAAARG